MSQPNHSRRRTQSRIREYTEVPEPEPERPTRSIVYEGWIEKCGPWYCPTWTRRWLVIYSSRVLEYYEDDTKAVLKRSIQLEQDHIVSEPEEIAAPNFRFGLNLVTFWRTYLFTFNTDLEKQECVAIIQQMLNELQRISRDPIQPITDVHEWANSSEGQEVLQKFQNPSTTTTLCMEEMTALETVLAPQIDAAREYTRQVMDAPAAEGRLGDMQTAMRVLGEFSLAMGKEPLFFDEKNGEDLPDCLTNPHVAFHEDTQKISLRLTSVDELIEECKMPVVTPVSPYSLDHHVKTGGGSESDQAVLDCARTKLARAHGVRPDEIHIHRVYQGSLLMDYTVENLHPDERRDIEKMNGNLKKEFQGFMDMQIHPLFYRSYFSVSMFDARGNKDFTKESTTYDVGPPDAVQKYQQPSGWYRYGLKVLGKYATDDWLAPFGNPNMWHKAYHGTGSTRMGNGSSARGFLGRNDGEAQLNAAANIVRDSVRIADGNNGSMAVSGNGVYCGTLASFYDTPFGGSYVGKASIKVGSGSGSRVSYQFVLMVAVNPKPAIAHTKKKSGQDEYWVVNNSKDVRPYGLLLRKS